MGSGSSKGATSSSAGCRRSRRTRAFNYTCFRIPSTLQEEKEEEYVDKSSKHNSDRLEYSSPRNSNERCAKHRHQRQKKICSIKSSIEHSEDDGHSTTQTESGAGSSSAAGAVGESSSHSGRSRSRLNFIPDSFGFRLSRTISLGTSRGCSFFSDNISSPINEGGDFVAAENQNEIEENVNAGNISSSNVAVTNRILESTTDTYSQRNHTGFDTAEVRRANRRLGPQEALEDSVRFSRTLSVGRLRDRVLRRTSSSAGVFDDTAVGNIGQSIERSAIRSRQREPSPSNRIDEVWPDSSANHPYRIDSLTDDIYDHELENPHFRSGSNPNMSEHRSTFVERRRRIRSQVRALQRLGSRFENLSGHDRSCILSGQHRSGRCTCRASNRTVNSNDETGTRASISRIVMLAEALFEVLDEIHQQSVALSSRTSFSSTGSVPAPKEVVECMPVKVYVKPQRNQYEEAAQCYICLVEYESGDFVRTLPCNHDFHQTCVDKWLKEIHRVCPLCRGDVCRADTSGSKKIS